MRAVYHHSAVDLESVLLHPSHHADDGGPRTIRSAADALADGVAAGPEAIGELLVDDDDGRHVRCVLIIEEAPFDKRDFHGSEVVDRCDALVHLQLLTGSGGP